MADRAQFLKLIRHRTQTGKYKPTQAPDVPWTSKGAFQAEEPIEDPPVRFLEELEALGGHGRRVESLEEAREYVLALTRERETRSSSSVGTLRSLKSSTWTGRSGRAGWRW